jgi:hypothetical protein
LAIQLKTGPINLAGELKTIDPDLWFSSSRLRPNFQAELANWKVDNDLEFLSLLVAAVAPAPKSASERDEVAMVYMEQRVSISSEWRKRFAERHKRLLEARSRWNANPGTEKLRKRMDEAQTRLEEVKKEFPGNLSTTATPISKAQNVGGHSWLTLIMAGAGHLFSSFFGGLLNLQWAKRFARTIRKERNAHSTASHAEPPVSPATDYYFQILGSESLERVFGHVLARLIRTIKAKGNFVIRQANSVPTNVQAGETAAMTDTAGRVNEGTGSEDDGGMFAGLFDSAD